MSSHVLLVNLMRRTLSEQNIQEVTASGEFVLSTVKPILFPGAVYGFAIRLSETEKKAFFIEAVARGLSRFTDAAKFVPILEDLYPIYWGKDKQLGARLHQHLGNPVKTGVIRLSTYKALEGKTLACASLVVSDNSTAELALQRAYPGLLKTTTTKYVSTSPAPMFSRPPAVHVHSCFQLGAVLGDVENV